MSRRLFSFKTAALMGAGLAALRPGAPAVAQEAQEPGPSVAEQSQTAAEREGVDVFAPEFFADYNPVTALDMVQRVPGFSIDGGGGGGGGFPGGGNFSGGNRRGFAVNATNVLINGERPSSKTSISSQLSRISASNVRQVELIRGAGLAAMDVRGQTQIVNVVLREGAGIRAETSYIAELNYSPESGRVGRELQLTRSFQLFGGDLSAHLALPTQDEYGVQTETVTDVNDQTLAVRQEHNHRGDYPIELSGAASWTPTGRDVINANGEISSGGNHESFTSVVFDGMGNYEETELRTSDQSESLNGEFGGDWEHQFTDRVSFKILGLLSRRQSTSQTEQLFFTPADLDSASLVTSDSESGERIARGTWTWRANNAHTVEAGLEAAFNYLDSTFTIEAEDAAGDLTGVVLFNDDTRVEEIRGEAFVTDVWTVNPRLTLESGFVFEASRISQIRENGDPYERELSFPKPRLIATYARQSGDQIRLSIERDVGQLNFQDFASQVNLGDDRTESGNPELEPERAWKSSLQWERRFGARGAFTLETFYDAFEYKEDRVPLYLPTLPYPLDAAGNLGDGRRYGVRIDATLPLDGVGLAGGELRMRGTRQKSEVEDGVTGVTRSFSGQNDWSYNFDYRQDAPTRKLAWGVSYQSDGLRSFYRSTETQKFGPKEGFLTAYLETTRLAGLTVRLQVGNALNGRFIRERSLWRTGDFDTGVQRARDTGPPDFVEFRDRTRSPTYSLRVSGAF